ncbi:hypothetical protein ACFO0N_15030 [Halobium salinum]|uniref:Uncharacterized protein n=1 Tax=Halobium salinum TaxID=1364940 RepID=A0ABD5PER0_9EURY|nr:hypothetical protein [Halobium salinum]
MIPNESHPGSNPAELNEKNSGLILLAERQNAHEEFIEGYPGQLTIVLRINHVQTLLNKDHTAESFYGPDVTVITTTTVSDQVLADLTWEKERDLIQRFNPDYHVPCDYPVYKSDDGGRRRDHVENYLRGLLWLSPRLQRVELIPLVKGETPDERLRCYKVFQSLGAGYVVFYGTQYFTSRKGFKPLRQDICQVVSEQPDLNIMLFGLQSPRLLRKLPPQVVAAVGRRWIGEIQLRDRSVVENNSLYDSMKENVESELGQGQMPLGVWSSTEVMA